MSAMILELPDDLAHRIEHVVILLKAQAVESYTPLPEPVEGRGV